MRDSANDSSFKQNNSTRIETKKNWREISKTEAALITLCIVLIYTILHWWFIKDGYFLNLIYISTVGFFIGFAFGFFEVIEPGTNDSLIFGGKKLKQDWEDGYCFVPSVLPFMHRLKFRPLWSLLKKHWSGKLQDDNTPAFNHDLKIDSSNQQKININASLLEATIFQTGSKFFSWFFSMNSNSQFAFQEFGLKIILLLLVLDSFNLITMCIVNFFSNGG